VRSVDGTVGAIRTCHRFRWRARRHGEGWVPRLL